jgi:dephospho-CoA kinase
MIIGLTGGMGCGKSTAAKLFEALGYRRVDSDELVKTVILADPEVIGEVVASWGKEMIGADGAIDRRALAGVIFTDDQARLKLEQMVHPRLFALWRKMLHDSKCENWIFEVPLLFEKELENWFDFIICVASSAQVQVARLQKRGITHALAEQRISKQWPLVRKQELADMVLWNDGSLDFLRTQVVFSDQQMRQ